MEEKESLSYYGTVYDFLRTFADELLRFWSTNSDDSDKGAEWIRSLCANSANIFLGKNDAYHADELWNKPGVIDEYLATIFPFPTTDPFERMCWFFIVFANKLRELCDFASTPGVLGEQWKNSGALMYQEFAMMLMGIPLQHESDDP